MTIPHLPFVPYIFGTRGRVDRYLIYWLAWEPKVPNFCRELEDQGMGSACPDWLVNGGYKLYLQTEMILQDWQVYVPTFWLVFMVHKRVNIPAHGFQVLSSHMIHGIGMPVPWIL